jgi:hypothetical protein
MTGINDLLLEKVLFYLSILSFGNLNIAKLSLENVSIKMYGTIIENLSKEVLISDLNGRLNSLFQDHVFREELTFGFTPEKYEGINPNYFGKTVTYSLQKNGDDISLFGVNI